MNWILFELRIAIIDKGNLIFLISNRYKWRNFILVADNRYRWRKFNFASQLQLSMDRILFEFRITIIDEENLIFVISNQNKWQNSIIFWLAVININDRILFWLRIIIIDDGNLVFVISNQYKWQHSIVVGSNQYKWSSFALVKNNH